MRSRWQLLLALPMVLVSIGLLAWLLRQQHQGAGGGMCSVGGSSGIGTRGRWRLREHPVRVYDIFLANTEVELLEVRLRTLADVVDYFVVVESAVTCTNQPRPSILDLSNSWRDLEDKVISIRVPQDANGSAWAREFHQRRRGFYNLLHEGGGRAPAVGDVLVMSDVDEIPRPEVLLAFKQCTGYEPLEPIVLLCTLYYYYGFEFKSPEPWYGHQVFTYNGTMPDAQALREFQANVTMDNACWHCSYCFPYSRTC